MGSVHPNEPFSLIFCDPPYGKNLAPQALSSTLAGGWVTNNALFVVEERADVSVELPAGLVMLEQRNYGDTQIIFARFKG
jgi:16S rRNA (guanine966-N2)-methyltransferase